MIKIVSALSRNNSNAICLIDNNGVQSVVEIQTAYVDGIYAVNPSTLSVEEYNKLEPLSYDDPLNVDITIRAAIENMRNVFDSIFTNLP